VQALGAPGKTEKALITRKVTTRFSVPPCTPVSYASFSRPTEVLRLKARDYNRVLEMPVNILLGVCNYRAADWIDNYYPDDLPQDWQLDFYANDYPLVCLSEAQWLERHDMEWPEKLRVFVEVRGSVLEQLAGALSNLPAIEGIIVHDESSKIELEKIGVKCKVVLARSVTNGWLVNLVEGRLVCLKPTLPLDLRVLRKDIDTYFKQINDRDGYLLLDAPPMALEQCRTLLDLACL